MASPASSCDVAVVGLGAMGAAALYQLARRGVKAIGIDRFAPPHDRGSTHGETRITRQALGEGMAYVPLALRSNEIWRELEAETGASLLNQCGCLIVGRMDRVSNGPIRTSFLPTTREAAETYGIAHEILDAADIRRRYPQFTPQDGEIGYFEPGGGYLNPEGCVAAQIARAQALGARVRLGTVVRSVRPVGDGVEIETDDGPVAAAQAIVSAGSWAPALLGAPFDRLLTPRRQVMHWFALHEDMAETWMESPVFIWAPGSDPRDFFYGFPALPGGQAVKTAGEQYEEATTPETIDRAVGAAESRAMYDKSLSGRVQGIGPAATKTATCLYTHTPDSDFLIDRHPDYERILVVSPCSGHGFKHSAAIGEAAAEVVTEGRARIDLSPFALSRFEQALAG